MHILETISNALGLDSGVQDMTAWQMVLRAIVVYAVALLTVKAAKRRFMSQHSIFDFVMVIILGAVVSRAINGSAPFLPTLAASFALVAVHRLMSWASFRWRRLAAFVEGWPILLAQDGAIDWEQMRAHDFTEQDLRSALRRLRHTDQLRPGESVVLEPNGDLSVVGK